MACYRPYHQASFPYFCGKPDIWDAKARTGCMLQGSPGSSLPKKFPLTKPSSLRQASTMASSSPMGSQKQPLRILDPVSFTQRVLEVFDARGSTGSYEKEAGQWHLPIAQELVKRAGLRAGQDVLDIATGTGGAKTVLQRQRLVSAGPFPLHSNE